jgi:IS30 family transposase
VKRREEFKNATIIYDRGSEFAPWCMVERDTDAQIFFVRPHHPWEPGRNENTRGRLRRIFLKRADFRVVSKRELAAVVNLRNHLPRIVSWRAYSVQGLKKHILRSGLEFKPITCGIYLIML